MKKLSFKQKILVSLTLFGMFFGAGNLIFPVHLGQLAGRNVISSIIGFCVTAVTIPILGVAAIGKTHSDGLQELANKVSKKYSIFFTCLLYLTIGPFFAIPRCATVSFTSGITPLLNGVSETIVLLIFTFIFFAFTLFFSLRPNKITVWIGKIINPVFLIFFSILLITALSNPSTSISLVEPDSAYVNNSFFSSFIEGYGTMDAIAGLAFGIVVINIIRSMGVTDDDAISKDVLSSGILTGLLMALIYVLTIIVGAQSRGLFETSQTGGIALGQIANYYLGNFGSIVLAITITFACLKTAIGLVTSCAETFAKMFPDSLSYRSWVIVLSIFSFVVSNFGLVTIINYSLPVLMFLYPLAISLILLSIFGKLFNYDTVVYKCVTAFTIIPAIFDMLKTLPENLQVALNVPVITSYISKILPLFDINLGWLIPSIIGLIIGLIIRKNKNQ